MQGEGSLANQEALEDSCWASRAGDRFDKNKLLYEWMITQQLFNSRLTKPRSAWAHDPWAQAWSIWALHII